MTSGCGFLIHHTRGLRAWAFGEAAQGLAAELEQHRIAVNALRIELNIVTEGWVFRNPGIDFSTWEKPEAPAQAALWLATRDLSYTGKVVTIAEEREAMAAG